MEEKVLSWDEVMKNMYPFVVEQLKAGTPRDEIIQALEEKGMEKQNASILLKAAFEELSKQEVHVRDLAAGDCGRRCGSGGRRGIVGSAHHSH